MSSYTAPVCMCEMCIGPDSQTIDGIICPVCGYADCSGDCCDCEECAPQDFEKKKQIKELRDKIRCLIRDFDDFLNFCDSDHERYNVKPPSDFIEKFDPLGLLRDLDGVLTFAGGAITSDELFVIASRFEEMDARMHEAFGEQNEKVRIAMEAARETFKELRVAEEVDEECWEETRLVGKAPQEPTMRRRETARSIRYSAVAVAASFRRSLERRRPKRVPFHQKDVGMDAIWSEKIANALLIENALRQDADQMTAMARERRKTHQAARKRGRLTRKIRDEKWSLW